VYGSSTTAEDAFYDAFRAGDVEAMMRVWAASVDVACVHPSGPRLESVPDIRRSWELIFQDGVQREFDLRCRRIVGTDAFRIHLVEENITVAGTSLVSPPVLATNVYQQLRDGWYMVLHHASVSPFALPDEGEERSEAIENTPMLH
jgi:ketosteroid isomerase-like protein